MLNTITNIVAWFIKNVSMLSGILGAITKLIAGILHFWSPPEDSWVNKIDDILLVIQANLYKVANILKKFKSSTS